MGGMHYNRIDLLALLNSPEEHVAVDVMRSAFGAIMNLYSGAASPWLEDAFDRNGCLVSSTSSW
jgi:hypothetical protein